MKTKIEWTDYTWNPVWGCKNNCEYCYARSIAKRFGKTADERVFDPVWKESNFNKKFPKKPSRIFVNSMSDIFYWHPKWMKKVLKRIKEYPQHTFQFLTKHPKVYKKYKFPENCHLGITVTTESEMKLAYKGKFFKGIEKKQNKIFISIEPILEYFDTINIVDWIIVGAETGNRKGKVLPEKKWINTIKKLCKFTNIKYFEKDSIKPIVNRELIREFPT